MADLNQTESEESTPHYTGSEAQNMVVGAMKFLPVVFVGNKFDVPSRFVSRGIIHSGTTSGGADQAFIRLRCVFDQTGKENKIPFAAGVIHPVNDVRRILAEGTNAVDIFLVG